MNKRYKQLVFFIFLNSFFFKKKYLAYKFLFLFMAVFKVKQHNRQGVLNIKKKECLGF